MTNVIPKNARFTIKDVKTGKTFEVVRWSGYNHIDAEPRTAEDTATMKSIYGGEWSWSRRAILIPLQRPRLRCLHERHAARHYHHFLQQL